MIIFFFITLSFSSYDDDRRCVVQCARNQIGKPYVWGAEGPDSFDCSGLCCYCFDQCGYGFGYRASTKELIYEGIESYEDSLILADIVFPYSGHVQIYSGDGNIIHAPNVNEYVREEAIYQFWRARRIILGDTDLTPNDGGEAGDSGTLTFLYEMNVRSEPSHNSEVVAQYSAGDTCVYDSVVRNTECTWISYIGGSGKRRYVCARSADGTPYTSPCPAA